jgi:hypothetical protein
VRETACRDCLAARSFLALQFALQEVLPLLETVVSVAGYTVDADLDTTRHSSSGVGVVKSTPISCTNKPSSTRLFGFSSFHIVVALFIFEASTSTIYHH